MKLERPNAIEVLEQEKKWYKEQIQQYEEQMQRIDAAIKILKGEGTEPKEDTKPKIEKKITDFQTQTKRKRRKRRIIQWSAEIDKIFEVHDELSTKEILKKLEENGITEVLDKKRCNNVYSTLVRKIHQKHPVLEKTEKGIYRIIKQG